MFEDSDSYFGIRSLQKSCLCFMSGARVVPERHAYLVLCFVRSFRPGPVWRVRTNGGHVGTKLRAASDVKLQALCALGWRAGN